MSQYVHRPSHDGSDKDVIGNHDGSDKDVIGKDGGGEDFFKDVILESRQLRPAHDGVTRDVVGEDNDGEEIFEDVIFPQRTCIAMIRGLPCQAPPGEA